MTDIQEIVDMPLGGKKNVVLDATVLTTIMNCPRLADLRFNHNFVGIEGKSNSLECGSIVHTFLEFYYGLQAKGMSRSMSEGHAFAAAELYISGCKFCTDFTPHTMPDGTMVEKPVCGHKVNQFPGVQNTPRIPNTSNPREKYLIGWEWVLETCKQYIDHYRSDHWVTLDTEVVKGKVLYEDEEIRILWKAKLDWIIDTNQGIYPADHKTMKQRRQTNSQNNQFIGQCLVMDTSSMFINKIGFQTTLKPAEKFERVMVPYSKPRLMEWQSEILPYYAKLLVMYAENGHYPPNFTNCESKYGNCSFYEHVCTADPDMREEELKLHFKVGEEWNPTNDED